LIVGVFLGGAARRVDPDSAFEDYVEKVRAADGSRMV
jgi:hypothetical protein